MPDFRGSVDFRVFGNILGQSCDLSRSKEKITFIHGGRGVSEKISTEIEKKEDFGRYYFVDLEVMNAYLCPI